LCVTLLFLPHAKVHADEVLLRYQYKRVLVQ
jgi:hypothetical protein